MTGKMINDFKSSPFVLSYVEGLREFFRNLLTEYFTLTREVGESLS